METQTLDLEHEIRVNEKAFEISQNAIYVTRDYSFFHNLVGQRDISQNHVDRIKKSMEDNDLHHLRPIMVDKRGGVIEGQHTLEARKQMNAEVHFLIGEKQLTKNIIRFNGAIKKMTTVECCLIYAKEEAAEIKDGTHYSDFQAWLKDNGVSFEIAFNLFIADKKGSTDFRDGEFMFSPSSRDLEVLDVVFAFLRISKTESRSRTIVRASRYLSNHKDYEHERMIKQIGQNPNKVNILSSLPEQIKLMSDIYNAGYHFGKGQYIMFF